MHTQLCCIYYYLWKHNYFIPHTLWTQFKHFITFYRLAFSTLFTLDTISINYVASSVIIKSNLISQSVRKILSPICGTSPEAGQATTRTVQSE